MSSRSDIARRFRSRRVDLGLSRLEVGERSGTSGQAVLRIEHGRNVQVETLLRIAGVLGISFIMQVSDPPNDRSPQ